MLQSNELLNCSFPGEDLVAIGLRDIARNQETIPALLVSIGAPRLRRSGIEVPRCFSSPEMRLYRRLNKENPNAAHSRFNALIRRLISFERAVECARHRT